MKINKIITLAEQFDDKYREFRREILSDLVNQIKGGEFHHIQIDQNKLYQLHNSVRHEYQSPKDISGYNSGHMSVWEMDAGMEESY